MVVVQLPQYFHKETKEKHAKILKELLDLNFGKDWRIFLNLYYSKEYGRHTLNYTNHTPVESIRFKNKNHAGKVRDGYYRSGINILKTYLTQGKEFILKEIEADKWRFKWYFQKGEAPQIIISDELYNKLLEQKEEVKEDMKRNSKDEWHFLIGEIQKTEADLHWLKDKRLEQGLDETEQITFNKLKLKLVNLQNRLAEWEKANSEF